MAQTRIVFFGGIGSSTEFGGELTKNKEIIARLQELGCRITAIDSFKSRSNKAKLLKVLFLFFKNVLLYPKATFIFSTSFSNVYSLFKILYWYPIKLNIVLWVIGGSLDRRILEGAYKHKYYSMINLFIMEGVKMKKRMVDLGFNNVWYVPNFKTIGKLPKVEKADDGITRFYFLSRIVPEKGCRDILKCVEELNRKGLADRFVVDFYGNIDGKYESEFSNKVSYYNNVKYCGCLQLLEEKNYEILARYHYMLFPTYWHGEGFPGVIIDAYKAGVPIIASDWNLNSEFIKDGKTGILTICHDTEQLRIVMENAILGKYDQKIMSDNCQKEVYSYDTKTVINCELLQVITNRK